MAIDDNYVYPFLVTVFSAKNSTSLDLRVLLAYDRRDLSPEALSFVKVACARMGVHLTPKELTTDLELPAATSSHISRTSWARILLLQTEAEEFVWLDSDLLLLAGWDTLLTLGVADAGFGIAACRESQNSANQQNQAVYASGDKYFNAGVLIIDPVRARKELASSLEWAIREYVSLGFEWVDQDVLNFCTKGAVQTLDPGFNIRRSDPMSPTKGPIIHFAGTLKPWNAITRFYAIKNPDVKTWNKVARKLLRLKNLSPSERAQLASFRRKAATRNGEDTAGLHGWKRLAALIIREIYS
jgi:lipopolysaccharide biosynthesis glycosyltransferase